MVPNKRTNDRDVMLKNYSLSWYILKKWKKNLWLLKSLICRDAFKETPTGLHQVAKQKRTESVLIGSPVSIHLSTLTTRCLLEEKKV